MIDPQRFEWIFRRKRSSKGLIPGLLDQEIQEIYLVRDDRPLTAFAPNFAELEGIMQVPVALVGPLFRGETNTAEGRVLSAETGEISVHVLTPEQLLVRGGDTYFIEVISEVEKRLTATD